MSMLGFDYGASFIAAYTAHIHRFRTPPQMASRVGCPHWAIRQERPSKWENEGRKQESLLDNGHAANAAVRADPRLEGYYEREARGLHHNVALMMPRS
jgi:hypothetical protein